MRKMLRLMLSVLLLACLAASLAACGGQKVETAPAGEAASAETEAAPPELEETLRNEPRAVAPETTDEDSEEPEDQVVSVAGITVVMPGRWAAKGLYWAVDERFQLTRLEYPLNGDRVQIAEIDWDERASLPYEADDELWTLGNVVSNGTVRPAVLHIIYVDSDGKAYSANTSVSDATLACEYFLGLSPEEILSWITVEDVQLPSQSSSSGLSGRRSEFCGVWAFASKELWEAEDFAADHRALVRGVARLLRERGRGVRRARERAQLGLRGRLHQVVGRLHRVAEGVREDAACRLSLLCRGL